MDTHSMYHKYMHREKYKYLRCGHTMFNEGSCFAEQAMMHSKWCDVFFRGTIKDKEKHREHVARGELQIDWVDKQLASAKCIRGVREALKAGYRRRLKDKWSGGYE